MAKQNCKAQQESPDAEDSLEAYDFDAMVASLKARTPPDVGARLQAEAKRLDEVRLAAGWSVGQLANLLEMSEHTLGSWLRGRAKPSEKRWAEAKEKLRSIMGEELK